ncbi:MAG: ComEC/Rec2 family competence protein, partial [Candidatus Izemoplasmatales bacterium]
MNRLKTILLWDSSKFVHLAIVSCLFALTKTSYIVIILLIIELIYLFKSSKNLLIYSFIIMALLLMSNLLFQKSTVVPKEGKIVAIEEKYMIIRNKGLHYLYTDNTKDYKLGMQIEFSGKEFSIETKNIPGNFDYQTYLKSKNVKSQLRVSNIKVIDSSFTFSIVPKYLIDNIDNKYSTKVGTYLKLFILGIDGLNEDMLEKTRDIGISHLFAISGMHISLILGFVTMILNQFFIKKKTSQFIITIFLLVYNIITGFSISIIRASMLTICMFFNNGRNFTKLDYLSFIMIGFLIYNPYLIYNIAYVLSFLISFSIILGQELISHKNKLIQVLKVGLLANLISLPIVLNLNGTLGVMNIIYNVVFVEFVSFIFLPLSFIILIIPSIANTIYLGGINVFESMVEFSHKANFYIDFKFTCEIFSIIYWLILLGLFVNFKSNKKFKYIFSLCSLLVLVYSSNTLIPSTYVRVLDVNQADAIHIHHNKYNILIDTGCKDNYDS